MIEDYLMFIIIGITVGLMFIVWFVGKIFESTSKEREKLKNVDKNALWRARYNNWLKIVQKNANSISGIYTIDDILLEKDEECLYVKNNVTLYVPKPIRYGHGVYGGASAYGLHGGGFQSTSESQLEYRLADIGKVCITNKRILYVGSMQSYDVQLEKILSIDFRIDGFYLRPKGHGRLSGSGGKTLVMAGLDGYIAKDIFKSIN